ncbi:hypothetical protein [Pelistega ratti]|uniref:hypothetical protein n=1 Tax=Pelistega ratti TaxID=2652177 RepID=UPI00135CD5D9|nr:hypothetical protein [Pelistega ratti]
MKIKHNEPYEPLRSSDYPEIGHQLDAIYKGFKSLQGQGIELPKETKEWLVQIEEIKRKYPKQ